MKLQKIERLTRPQLTATQQINIKMHRVFFSQQRLALLTTTDLKIWLWVGRRRVPKLIQWIEHAVPQMYIVESDLIAKALGVGFVLIKYESEVLLSDCLSDVLAWAPEVQNFLNGKAPGARLS